MDSFKNYVYSILCANNNPIEHIIFTNGSYHFDLYTPLHEATQKLLGSEFTKNEYLK